MIDGALETVESRQNTGDGEKYMAEQRNDLVTPGKF